MELTHEFTTLKRSSRALAEAHDKEPSQSKELGAAPLALARSHDALRRQLEETHQSVQSSSQDLHGQLDRVQVLLSCVSQHPVKVRRAPAPGQQLESHRPPSDLLSGNSWTSQLRMRSRRAWNKLGVSAQSRLMFVPFTLHSCRLLAHSCRETRRR